MKPMVKQRFFVPDLVRAVAIVGVLAIHLTYPIYARPDFIGGNTWWIAQIINSIFRISIPLFVMLSGYLLLGKNENIILTLKRAIKRLILPIVVWSFFYLAWNNYWFQTSLGLKDVINGWLSGGFSHLYFFFILLGLYLLLPVLRPMWQKTTHSIHLYFLGLSLTFGLLYAGFSYLRPELNGLNMFILTWLPYLGYFLAGKFLGDAVFNQKQLQLLGVVWVAAAAATAILGYFNLQWFTQGNLAFWGSSLSYFDHYLSINVMLASLAGFAVLAHIDYQKLTKSFFTKPIHLLAKTAMGLYVLHPFIMNIVDRQFGFQVDFMNENLWLYLIKRTVLVFSITTTLVWLAQKIPMLKKVLG